MSNLATTVQTIVKNSKKMTHKLAHIEHKLVAPSRYATSTISSLPDLSDATSTVTPLDQDLQDGHSSAQAHMPISNSKLNLELYNSRVYLRTSHRHSISSLPSAFGSTSGWSFLSGISLAQISNLSVLSLPIRPQDIWNPHHYEPLHQQNSLDGSDTRTKANSGHFKGDVNELVERQRVHLHNMIQRKLDISERFEKDRKALMKRANILLLGKSTKSNDLQEPALLDDV